MLSSIACLAVACLSLPAAAWDANPPLKGAVIVVDPGHGGQRYSKSYTGGTRGVASKTTESELNLRVSLELEKLLKEKGATVYMTRRADHRLSREGSSQRDELHARIDYLDRYEPHFFLSVHHNAAGPTATGHTALYKHNARDDTLYESLAREVNDALAAAVPGPKRKLIKGNYHVLRETDIPGTISEAGFLTNKAFDELAAQPGFAAKEAEAISQGAVRYWAKHRDALAALRDRLRKERAANPRNPNTLTATGLNPDFQARMKKLLAKVAPGGKYEAAKVGEYVEAYRKAVVTGEAKFDVKAEHDGKAVRLTGATSERRYHDGLIDLLVAMGLYDIVNEVRLPKAPSVRSPSPL